jgi:predicted ribosome quality control (RQC) complex YloA/Tae2 family protein
MTENYPDEMFEEAERREKENQVLQIAKDLIEQHGDAMKALAEIEKDELIDQAIEELGWIVAGGQDGEEFYNSINFIKRVLERCKQ